MGLTRLRVDNGKGPIKPMLATSQGKHEIDRLPAGEWYFDQKLDGLRATVTWDLDSRCDPYQPESYGISIHNRSGVDITALFPDVVAALEAFTAEMVLKRVSDLLYLVLDGEIVALTGSFEHVAIRGKQNDKTAAKSALAYPAKFVAFDTLHLDQTDGSVMSQPFSQRRAYLEMLERECDLEAVTGANDPGLLDLSRVMGWEGVIAKRATDVYKEGSRSPGWVKFKNTHTVSCVVAGYVEGKGARADFGAMVLQVFDPEAGPVEVGRVGTGFTEQAQAMLKAELDAGNLLVVEIECLNRTSGGQLRFPVYKGVRTDVEPIDCTIDQINALPLG